jgi:hypothetical protein
MQLYVGIVFAAMTVVLAAVFLGVARQAQVEPYEAVSRRGALIRRWWFRVLLAGGVVALFGISIREVVVRSRAAAGGSDRGGGHRGRHGDAERPWQCTTAVQTRDAPGVRSR